MSESDQSSSEPSDAALADEPWNQPSPWIAFMRKHIWGIGIIFFLVLITGMRPFLIHRAPPPEKLMDLPTGFELVDAKGTAFGPEQMQGKVWVVGFVFTRCPSSCPALSASMMRFQDMVHRAQLEEHIQVLTVTVDPEYDKPTVLDAYADELGADRENWHFVSGDPDRVRQFVVDGFKLAVGERAETETPGVFDIAHSTKLALVDRFGGIRGYYGTDPDGLEELFHRSLAVMRIREPEDATH